jgi:hypothetical protein
VSIGLLELTKAPNVARRLKAYFLLEPPSGLIDAASRSSSHAGGKQGPVDPKEYLRNPLWWAGSELLALSAKLEARSSATRAVQG